MMNAPEFPTLPLVLKRDELVARLYKERNNPHSSHWSPDFQDDYASLLNKMQSQIFTKTAYHLSSAQIALWRSDLLDAALHNAPQFADTRLPISAIPTIPQWWPAENLDESRHFKALFARMATDVPRQKLAGILLIPDFPTQSDWDSVKKSTEGMQVVFVHRIGFYLRLVTCSLNTNLRLSNGTLQTGIVSALSFMSQEFVQSKTIRLPTRFNGFRQSYVPCINQILLRARRSEIVPGSQADTDTTPKEWQHCWTVRAHARRLARPRKSDGQQVIWINACVKGDTAKPMLPPRDTIICVTR